LILKEEFFVDALDVRIVIRSPKGVFVSKEKSMVGERLLGIPAAQMLAITSCLPSKNPSMWV